MSQDETPDKTGPAEVARKEPRDSWKSSPRAVMRTRLQLSQKL